MFSKHISENALRVVFSFASCHAQESVILRGCEVCECILRYVEIRDVIEAVVLAAMRQLLRI